MSRRTPFNPGWLMQELQRLLRPPWSLCVAFSGGVDSTALLAALAQGHPPVQALRALHVDHGLQPRSKDWAEHCRELGRRLHVPLTVLPIEVPRGPGLSLEAEARKARYHALAAALQPGEVLLTAHHQDDQLETVLLQLLRGAGLPGLAAMPALTPFPPGQLARPLLSCTRAELAGWVHAQGLPYVEDESNANESLERNYLRRRILPLIQARWPGAGSAVSRSARHAAEAQQLLEEVAARDLGKAAHGAELMVPHLRRLPSARRRNALRFWITQSGHRPPDARRLAELAGPMLEARGDANPVVAWGDTLVRRHAGRLSISARRPPTDAQVLCWDWTYSCELPHGGRLALTPDPRGPLNLAALPAQLVVRTRSGGERLTPVRGGARRAVKSLLQEARIPLSQRAHLPLIFAGDTLIAVADLWLDASVQADGDTPSRGRLIWTPVPLKPA